MNKNSKINEQKEFLEIIGFKIFSSTKKIDFYTIIFYGDNDRPIMKNDRILFFTKLKFVPEIIENGLPETKNLMLSSRQASFICDLKEALRLIENEDIDNFATIIDSLNMIFDLVRSTKLNFPDQYKKALFLFADHLTFDRSISDFFEQTKLSRTLMIDGILWCIGAIFSKSIVVYK
jgi:hypothetical protein